MKDIASLLKLPPYILGALAIASGILLFSPDNLIQTLYMSEFRTNYGFAIGLVFIITIAILSVLLGIQVFKHIKKWYEWMKLQNNRKKFLLNMGDKEVEIIISLLKHPSRTVELPMHDGLVIELQYYNAISPAGQTHAVNMSDPWIPYYLQPWVSDQIKLHRELQKKFHFEK